MFSFDNSKFLKGYSDRFGPLNASLSAALEFLLEQIEGDLRFTGTDTDRRQLAYILATFKWETAHTMRPIDEFGSDDYFNGRYGPHTKVGKQLGNTQPGDGARFHGRGYVQLTGRTNYRRAKEHTGRDLLADPDGAKDPLLAYDIAIQGMQEGWFTGKKLGTYIRPNALPDYEGARRVINGQDKAQTIADIARRMDEILVHARNVRKTVQVTVNGTRVEGAHAYLNPQNESWGRVRPIAVALGAQVEAMTAAGTVTVHRNGQTIALPAEREGGAAYVRLAKLALLTGVQVSWQPPNTVVIT